MAESVPVYSISHFMESHLAISANGDRRISNSTVSESPNQQRYIENRDKSEQQEETLFSVYPMERLPVINDFSVITH